METKSAWEQQREARLINIMNKDGAARVSSREVANNFEKQHKHVLRDIENILGASPDLRTPNLGGDPNLGIPLFIETTYIHEQNKQEYKEYLMTRDGFTLLGMGFSGPKAMKWKLKYIEAFNRMEEELRRLNQPSYMITDDIERAKVWIKEQEEKKKLQLENKQNQQLIGELKPKADYVDKILRNKSLMPITPIAKDYGMSGQAFNQLLHEHKVQYQMGKQWLLYSQHQSKGYTHSEPIEITRSTGNVELRLSTKWTQKGRLFIYELLKKKGILPMIEQLDMF